MKDITVIIMWPSDRVAFHKSLQSLHRLNARITSIVVMIDSNSTSIKESNMPSYSFPITLITVNDVNAGECIDQTINQLASSYVLFLQDSMCLSPNVNSEFIQLPDAVFVLATNYVTPNNIPIQMPLFVCTAYMQQQTKFSVISTPFKEGLLPIWLSLLEETHKISKKDCLKQARRNRSATSLEKERFVQKHQSNAITSSANKPSLSVMLANYNMQGYVANAVASCHWQTEPFEQILVIDDGSTDRSYQQLLQWEKQYKIQLLHKKNEGKAKALNKLLPYVSSEFILELDADDWLDPDAVSIITTYLMTLPQEIGVLYGNFRRWKQRDNNLLYKGISQGKTIKDIHDLMAYRFPLGPRIYRTSMLKKQGGFPIIEYEGGRLYEDVAVLKQLFTTSLFRYQDFTIYNVREHPESITKKENGKWKEFLRTLNKKSNR
ncbi:glycosyltransferase family 2 protein [Virgibacillus salexigens]|uniref:glycosyltransferase family 2 protein n=1 Tax=Virgibacillus salexigens TaxID=61016 RepID=UPI003081D4FE